MELKDQINTVLLAIMDTLAETNPPMIPASFPILAAETAGMSARFAKIACQLAEDAGLITLAAGPCYVPGPNFKEMYGNRMKLNG